MKNKKINGYFTIEAALLMPVFLCVTVLLCYLAFYMCNRVVLLRDTYVTGLRGSLRQEMTNKEVAAYALQQSEGLAEKYYAVSQMNRKVQVNGKEIVVEIECEMQIPFDVFIWMDRGVVNREWKIKEKKIIDRTNPAAFIRTCRKIEKVMER